MFKGRLPLKGAPYWYNTPIEDLDFEWTAEEKLEIDRYCEKILKNIANEGGMTPLERYNAWVNGKDKDRMFMGNPFNNPYSVRVLDSFSDAMKPIDMYKYPKLFIKGHLATVARFGLDWAVTHNINYGEDMFGGQSKMIEYGNPILESEPPIKSLEDLEGIPIPDPYKDGLYPGYLWAHREMRRIYTEYGLKLPLMGSVCPGPPLMVMMGMMGWTQFAMGLRKNPELTKACLDLAVKWLVPFGKAMMDTAQPDMLCM